MAAVQMNLAMAQSWMGEIESLNSQLQSELSTVNQSVQTIGQDASGSIVGELMKNANDMIQSTTGLINAFANLVGAVGGVIHEATGLVDSVVEGIAKVGKYFM